MRILNPIPALAIFLTLLIGIAFLNCDNTEKFSPEKEAAINSARHWIALIDSGRYEQSWQIASAAFKADVTQRQWRIGLEQIRAPYGRVKSRNIKATKPLEDRAGGARQKKLVVEFTTFFENQFAASEFVTVLLENDAIWRVSAYYLDR